MFKEALCIKWAFPHSIKNICIWRCCQPISAVRCWLATSTTTPNVIGQLSLANGVRGCVGCIQSAEASTDWPARPERGGVFSELGDTAGRRWKNWVYTDIRRRKYAVFYTYNIRIFCSILTYGREATGLRVQLGIRTFRRVFSTQQFFFLFCCGQNEQRLVLLSGCCWDRQRCKTTVSGNLPRATSNNKQQRF